MTSVLLNIQVHRQGEKYFKTLRVSFSSGWDLGRHHPVLVVHEKWPSVLIIWEVLFTKKRVLPRELFCKTKQNYDFSLVS